MALRDPDLEKVRWALTVALAYMLLAGGDAEPPTAAGLFYVGVLLASNVVVPRLRIRSERLLLPTLLLLDTLLVVAGLALSGSTSRDLLVAWFLCVVMAAFADSERRIGGAALLVSGVYALWTLRAWPIDDGAFALRLPFLFVTTVFYGLMMLRVRREHDRRLGAEARARGLRHLLEATRSFSSTLATPEILDRVAQSLAAALGVSGCRIELVDGTTPAPVPPEVAEALVRKAPVAFAKESAAGVRPVLAVPIVHAAEPLGALIVETAPGTGPIGPAGVTLCQVTAGAAAIAIRNARQYESLLRMEAASRHFLSNLAHELRTPLGAILLQTELAAERAAPDSPLEKMIGQIARGAQELAAQVDAVVHSSHAALEPERVVVGRIDLQALLSGLAAEAARVWNDRGVVVHVDVDPSLGEIYADGPRIERIVRHMLWNALQRGATRTLRLTAALGGDAGSFPNRLRPWEQLLAIAVRESVAALDLDELERVFRALPEPRSEAGERENGLELGLSLCRRLADLLRGALRVEERPGHGGAVLEVRLPVMTSGYRF